MESIKEGHYEGTKRHSTTSDPIYRTGTWKKKRLSRLTDAEVRM